MSDEHDEWATVTLPCVCRSAVDRWAKQQHRQDNTDCPAFYRPAVAAARRWQAEVAESNKRLYLAASADAAKHKAEVEKLGRLVTRYEGYSTALEAQRADLRAKLEEAVFHLRTYEEADGYHGGYGPHHLSRKIKDLEAKLAEAERK